MNKCRDCGAPAFGTDEGGRTYCFACLMLTGKGSKETRQRNDRDRAYDGQPQTNLGLRGKTLVEGLTMRDVRDCFVKAWLLSHGECPEFDAVEDGTWTEDMVYTVSGDVDPIAVAQNLTFEIEKMMGIFPNVPGLYVEDEEHDDAR